MTNQFKVILRNLIFKLVGLFALVFMGHWHGLLTSHTLGRPLHVVQGDPFSRHCGEVWLPYGAQTHLRSLVIMRKIAAALYTWEKFGYTWAPIRPSRLSIPSVPLTISRQDYMINGPVPWVASYTLFMSWMHGTHHGPYIWWFKPLKSNAIPFISIFLNLTSIRFGLRVRVNTWLNCVDYATNHVFNLTVGSNPIEVKFKDMIPEGISFNFNSSDHHRWAPGELHTSHLGIRIPAPLFCGDGSLGSETRYVPVSSLFFFRYK